VRFRKKQIANALLAARRLLKRDAHPAASVAAVLNPYMGCTEIEGVSGRVRRLLRQRPDKDISSGAQLDPIEVEETAALIDFVAVCRNYASELAINEVTMRTYSDLQHYVERTAETLVESLRNGEERVRAFRQQQVKAVIRFCEVLFGQDYSSLMSRAADHALTVERKSSRAG